MKTQLTFALGLAVAALQLMLDKGKELDWFESGEIVALGLVALVAHQVVHQRPGGRARSARSGLVRRR